MDQLSKANVFLNKVGGADKAFRIVYYLSKLLSNWLEQKHRLDSASSASHSGPWAQAGPSTQNLPALIERVDKLADQLSNARYMLRFFGLPSTFESWYAACKETDAYARRLQQAQALSMFCYYPLEFAYWLHWKGIVTSRRGDSFSLWSCRCWTVYIVLEMMSLHHQYQQVLQEEGALRGSCRSSHALFELIAQYNGKPDTSLNAALKREHMVRRRQPCLVRNEQCHEDSGDGVCDGIVHDEAHVVHLLNRLHATKKQLLLRSIVNLCDLPLAITWSTEKLPISKKSIGLFGSISSLIGIYLNWKAIE